MVLLTGLAPGFTLILIGATLAKEEGSPKESENARGYFFRRAFLIALPRSVIRDNQFLEDGGIGGNDTKGGGCSINKVFAAGKVLGLLMVSTECLETTPGNVGSTMEKTFAEDLVLEGKVFCNGQHQHP